MDAGAKLNIEHLQALLAKKTAEIVTIKQTINMLYEGHGQPKPYPDSDLAASGVVSLGATIKGSQFSDKPLATSIKEYLTMKGDSASVDEIFDALKRGGFPFKNGSDDQNNRALRISLGKNPAFKYIKGNQTYWISDKQDQEARKKEADSPKEAAEKVKVEKGGSDK